MCDVIDICLKGKDERRSWKGNPEKMANRRISMTSNMTLSAIPIQGPMVYYYLDLTPLSIKMKLVAG